MEILMSNFKKSNLRKCPYTNCLLPKDNKQYFIQIAYLFIIYCVLIKDESQFNFLSILLFVTPIVFDLTNNKLRINWLDKIRIVFALINILLIIFCLLGVFGIFIDRSTYFETLGTLLIFKNIIISKTCLSYLLIFDIFIPSLYYFGMPNQSIIKTRNIFMFAKEIKERKRA
jgi:hypothetical protein